MELLTALKLGEVHVRYTKLNGEEAHMYCTLCEEFIPEEFRSKKKEKISDEKKRLEGLISVFNTDKKGWRSFYLENVISASVFTKDPPV
jgi:hypothetical protein